MLMRKLSKLMICILLLLFCTSCDMDNKNIEMLNYALAIGVDYRDGNFYCYLQFNDFNAIGKTENQSGKAKVWVGEGVADTFDGALFELYRTAQERIYWGHLTAVVISEAAFKEGFEQFYDIITRYYEFRRTPWVFGTRESVRDILSSVGFFSQSSLSTILHEPLGTYSQRSTVKPIQLFKVVSDFYEPSYTTCIPTLGINNKQWTTNKEHDPMLKIDGAIFLKDKTFRSYIPISKLSGLRLVQNGSVRANISVPNTSKYKVNMIIENPKSKIKVASIEDKPKFNLSIKANSYPVSLTKRSPMDIQTLTKATKESIEDEVRKLYAIGLELDTDILNLEHQLYRYHYKEWKSLASSREHLLDANSLSKIDVKLDIVHSSSKKYPPIKEEQ